MVKGERTFVLPLFSILAVFFENVSTRPKKTIGEVNIYAKNGIINLKPNQVISTEKKWKTFFGGIPFVEAFVDD